MFKKVVILPTILLTLFCMTVFSVSAHSHKNKSAKQSAISDGVIYALVFDLVDDDKKEAEKTTDEHLQNYFKNRFVNEAGLTESQFEVLRTISQNFISASRPFQYRKILSAHPDRSNIKKN